MATVELEPLFVKALKLMHSRRPNALEELKQMTDEAIALRRGELALKKLENEGKSGDIKSGIKREHGEAEKKGENAKQSLEKLKEDLAFLTDDPVPVKKPKLESSSESKLSTWKEREASSKERERLRDSSREYSHRESKDSEDKEVHKPTLKEDPSWLDIGLDIKMKKSFDPTEKRCVIGSSKADGDSSDDDNDSSNFPGLDAEQFATDMMDLACVVCKRIDMTSGNRLLDCQECHRLYHQECHKPPVNEDVDDPRFVWYCSKCSKNMKKMVKSQKPKSSQNVTAKEKESTSVPMKAFRSESTIQTPFRRLDTSKVVSSSKDSARSSSSSSHPYTGLASLAANLSSKTHGAAGSSSTSWSKSSKSGRPDQSSKPSTTTHSSKVDNSKGLGFLFKPDAHKITNLSSQKSTTGEKGGIYKMGSSSKVSASGKSSTSSAKPAGLGMSLLAKTTVTSSSATKSGTSGTSLSRSSSSSSISGSSSTSGKGLQSSSIMSADKKVQLMKKKAAAKAAEKKSLR